MALCFDFDQTLSNKDIYYYKITPDNIQPITNILGIDLIDSTNHVIKIYNDYYGLSTIFNDYDSLKELFTELHNNYKLCVTSYGKIDVIEKIISIAFTNIFDLIITSDNYKELALFNNIKDIPSRLRRAAGPGAG